MTGNAQALEDTEVRVLDGQSLNEVALELSKGDLASHAGMSLETLSRKLSYFQKMGWIKLEGRRKIVILDKQSLASLI